MTARLFTDATALDAKALNPITSALTRHNIALSSDQTAQIAAYAGHLHRWNRRINLSGARTLETLLHRHMLDCLMLATVPGADQPCSWVDVGSGAGLPGLVLAILYPRSHITTVETVAKKATFLQFIIGELGLDNARVLRRDINDLSTKTPGFEPFDRMVARAFAPLPILLRLAPRLLHPLGELWAMKGERWEEEALQAQPSDLAPFAAIPGQTRYRLHPKDAEGIIVVYTLQGPASSDL